MPNWECELTAFATPTLTQTNLPLNARAGPICGGRTGVAMPKKIVTPSPPQRVDNTSDGTPKQLSMSSQLFMTQTSPDGLIVEFTVDPPGVEQIDEIRRADAHAELARWMAGDHRTNNDLRPH